MNKAAMKKVFGITKGIVGILVPQIAEIEKQVKAIPRLKGLKGKEKQDEVVNIVKGLLTATEGLTDRDLLNDPEVETATRGVIDAVVALQNVIAKKHAE